MTGLHRASLSSTPQFDSLLEDRYAQRNKAHSKSREVNLVAGNFRRGHQGMSQEDSGGSSKKGGQFPGFIRNMLWKDKDEKYILFLNRASDIPTVEYHSFIP